MTLLKNKAIQAMLIGDWENAMALNKLLIDEDPKDIDALNRLAYTFTILGKVQEAKTTYKKVLKIDVLNQIAIRNIKKLTELEPDQIKKNLSCIKAVNSIFLEETGKTKIISLVNTAQPEIIALLNIGQSVIIAIKRSRIFIQNQNEQYLGVLPDDIGKRLIRLIKGGNAYAAYIKSVTEHNITVFIKETKRTSRYRNHPSFPHGDGKSLGLSKQKTKNRNSKHSEDEDNNYPFSSAEES